MAQSTPQTSPIPPAPTDNESEDQLLARYRVVGENHPSFQKLKEALARKQDGPAAAAQEELKAVLAAQSKKPVSNGGRSHGYWLWIACWGTFLALCLYILSNRFIAAHVQEIIAHNTHPIQIIASDAIGGWKSQEITAHILQEIDDLKPDRCVFLGHQMAKKEIVEYLSALSQIAKVQLILGADESGHCQLSDPQSPLRQFAFTELRRSRLTIRTQALLAFNNQTRKAVAFVGTYPYDLQESAQGEHTLIVIRGFEECSRLYRAYGPLLENNRTYGR
jgi:hypothetical protein